MNKLRFRNGQVHLVKCRVGRDTIIEAGDMCWLDGKDVKPASMFPRGENIARTRQEFARHFIGVAHQQTAAGDTTQISVDISPLSVYEMDVPAETYELGELLGPWETSNGIDDQTLCCVAAPIHAIARSVEYRATAAGTLRVSFASAFSVASANVNAKLG